jgi:hypothetical protein
VNCLTSRVRKDWFYGGNDDPVKAMEKNPDPVTASTAVGVAIYVAIMLAFVAHDDLGLSSAQIRSGAILAAATIALLVALQLFGKRPRKTG